MNIILRIILLLLSLWLCRPAYCETVMLKNGGSIEGVVQEETATLFVLDLGAGTMTINKDEVLRIEKSSEQDKKRFEDERVKYLVERGEFVPLGMEDISDSCMRAKEAKSRFEKVRNAIRILRDEISDAEKRLDRISLELAAASKKLKTLESENDVKEYNNVVAEMNVLSADINKQADELSEFNDNENKLMASLGKKLTDYRNEFQKFQSLVSGIKNTPDKVMASDTEIFLDTMRKNIKIMQQDFEETTAKYMPAEGGHIIVDALINGKNHARLLVDTGASIVVLSKSFADRIGINSDGIESRVQLALADGKRISAKPVILESIRVSGAAVKNVKCAIVDGEIEPSSNVNGLLGMSFLNNFVIRIDSASSSLVLEKLF